jgi:hypothetical protein
VVNNLTYREPVWTLAWLFGVATELEGNKQFNNLILDFGPIRSVFCMVPAFTYWLVSAKLPAETYAQHGFDLAAYKVHISRAPMP